jgi:hypothetical protein
MHKNLLFNDRFYFRIFSIILVLILFSNCTTTENATRLEKWSWMIQEEDKIFESSISEFGKLKPLVERNIFGRDIETPQEEYTLIQNSTEQFVEDICKNLSDWDISASKDWVERVNRYISTKNVNIEILEKSFDYKKPIEARGDCNSVSQKNQFILDDILKLVKKIKADLDDPQKHDRAARIGLLQNRIRVPIANEKEEEKSELYKKKTLVGKKYSNFTKDVNYATQKEFFATDITWRLAYIFGLIRGLVSYQPDIFTKSIAVIGLIAIGNSFLSPRLNDRDKVRLLPFTKKILFYDERLSDSDQLLKETHYVLINDKENRLPGFDEFAAALDFQISNYEELHQYFLTKDGIQFRTKEIEAICEKYKCNRQPDMELLKKNAKATIEELKKRRMASNLLN